MKSLDLIYYEEQQLNASTRELDGLIDEALAYDEVLRKSVHYLVSDTLQAVQRATTFFADEGGNPVPLTHYGMSPDWPAEALVTVTFAEHEGKTNVTLQHAIGSAPASERDMCQHGWTDSCDGLAEYLAKA